MNASRTKLGKNGRVVIPASFRDELGLKDGDDLTMKIVDGEVRISSPNLAIKRARDMVSKHVPEGVSLVDDLIAMRRAEAERE